MKIPTYKNIAVIQVFNELQKGNLERYFRYMRLFVEKIIVYDDHSSDGTFEYCLKNADVVLRGKKNEFANEILHKQILLNKALEFDPDFIFALDADEIFTDNAKHSLNEMLHECFIKDFEAISLKEINLWRSNKWRRVDSLFDDGNFVRIWRVTPGIGFEKIRKGLHQRHYPTTIRRVMHSQKISLLHFGFADELNVAFKYLNYKSYGQRGYDDLERLIDEKNLRLERVNDNLLPTEFKKLRQNKPLAKSKLESFKFVYSNKEKLFPPVYSIVCLIFKSTGWLDFVYNQILKYTPLDNTEIIFIANDADSDVIKYLSDNYFPHVIFENSKLQRKEWYINNVYRAWNYAGEVAKGDFLVFLNSDMALSPRWFENLIDAYDGCSVLSPLGVESGKYDAGANGINRNFGRTYEQYAENKFLQFADNIKEQLIKPSGLFMPLLIRRDIFDKIGRYPEGNIVPGSNIFSPKIAKIGQEVISGDVVLMKKLETEAVYHKTVCDSVIYHFQCGESENEKVSTDKTINIAICNDICGGVLGERVLWNYLIDYLPGTFAVDMAITGKLNFEAKARDYIEDKSTDLIIQNASFINLIQSNIPNIVYLQDDLRGMGNPSVQQENNLKLADVIVANTFQTALSYDEYDIEVIPVGVDSKLFKPKSRSVLRKKYNFSSGLIGIFVGSLSETKGWSKVQEVIENNTDIHFIIISKHDESFTRDNVTFYSKITQKKLSELLNCSNFFIIASPVETQCLAAIEANLCGIPVLMPLVGIYRDFSNSERCNVGVFTDQLLDGIEKIKYFKGNPRAQILKKNLSIEDSIQQWRSLIERTLIIRKQASIKGNQNANYNKKLNLITQSEQFIRTKVFRPVFGTRYLHLRDKLTLRYIRKFIVYLTKKLGIYRQIREIRDSLKNLKEPRR